MRKVPTILTGAMAFLTATAGTAFAQYTDSPPPEGLVEGAGGGAEQAGVAGDAAFTGGDASTAAIVALALVSIGLVALLVARRRATSS